MQHGRAAETHQTHLPSSYQLLPAFGTPLLSADPSAHHRAAGRSAAPAKSAEPTTDSTLGFCSWAKLTLEQIATVPRNYMCHTEEKLHHMYCCKAADYW